MLQFFFLKNTSMPKSTTLISNPIITNQEAHEMEESGLAREFSCHWGFLQVQRLNKEEKSLDNVLFQEFVVKDFLYTL